MVALIVGIVFVLFSIYSVLPVTWSFGGTGWWPYVVSFLKGGIPILAILIGLIAIFIGIADIKDRLEAKKEEAEEETEGDTT